jgi:hypothetical protein
MLLFTAVAATGCPKKNMDTIYRVVPSKTIVAPGEDFTVDVIIEPGTVNVAGAQFDLSYNRQAVLVNSVTEGDFLKQHGDPTFFMPGNIDILIGKITGVAQTIIGAGKSVNTPGTMATIHCTALTAGASAFALSNTIVGNKDGVALPLGSSIISQVTVASHLDLNLDGQVSLADMQVAAAVFGATGTRREDVNSDGVVNVLDLITIGQNVV